MGLYQLAELRLRRRRRLKGMPGRLYTADRRQEIDCRPLDVCPNGLGVYTEGELGVAERNFVLIIAEHAIELELIYTLENPGFKVRYRHGFKVMDRAVDCGISRK